MVQTTALDILNTKNVAVMMILACKRCVLVLKWWKENGKYKGKFILMKKIAETEIETQKVDQGINVVDLVFWKNLREQSSPLVHPLTTFLSLLRYSPEKNTLRIRSVRFSATLSIHPSSSSIRSIDLSRICCKRKP